MSRAHLGRAELTLEHPHAGLAGQPTRLAVCRAAARLRPRAQPGRVPVGQLKCVELANCTGDTIAQVADQAHHGVQRACDSDAWSSGSLPTPVHPSLRHPSIQGTHRIRTASYGCE